MARRIRDGLPGRQIPDAETVLSYVKRWEAGKVGMSERYRLAYAEAFEVDEAELFGPEHRHRSAGAMLSGLLSQGDLTGRIASVTGRHVGVGIVADLEARVHALRLADDVLAGGDLLTPVFRELDAAIRLQQETAHSDEVGRSLLSVIGEFAQIAGWVASDAGQYDRAADTYRLGISAAREAEDPVLESNLTGSLAYQMANVGDPREAVTLAEGAVAAAGADAPPRARALAWDRLAWAHVRVHESQAAMGALGNAAEALAEHDGREDPAYLYWVDSSELQIMEARAYTELQRPLRAVPLLLDVLGRYDATHARELALYLSWLAIALADANEPEEAAAAAGRMLELSAKVTSQRTAQRARVVLTRLEQYRDVAAVRELLIHRE